MNKSKYDKIEVPEQLPSVVYDAIEKGIKKQKGKSTIYTKVIGIAAMVLVAFVVPLNTIPAYAKTMQEIPVLGDICKIFTFREYHFEDEIQYIDAKIPKLSDTGKSDLEKRVNKEINKTINEELENSKKIAKEYYDAFITTGGDPEEFIPVGINIDYETKCINERYVSFIIKKSETYPSAYNNQYFYNIDMETGRYFTLKEWLGNDYKKIATKNIKDTVSNWSEEKKALLWKDVNYEDLINENTNFYINDKNQAVIVFEKYEVAVGAAGIMEFSINTEE